MVCGSGNERRSHSEGEIMGLNRKNSMELVRKVLECTDEHILDQIVENVSGMTCHEVEQEGRRIGLNDAIIDKIIEHMFME